MKKLLLILMFFVFGTSFSQSINDYNTAIVPAKFSFLKETNQYRLNVLTKMFMEKKGFVTYFDTDELPTSLANNKCSALFVDVQSDGNMFVTKLTVIFKDCRNKVLFTSVQGRSREKEYHVAYNEAIRQAFASFEAIKYKYNGGVSTANLTSAVPVETKVMPNLNSVSDLVLFAQPITNGFQLIDSTPTILMKIYKTSSTTTFIAVKENIQGVLLQKNGEWFFEYYLNEQLISEKMTIKF
jgi:hypothetical protein